MVTLDEILMKDETRNEERGEFVPMAELASTGVMLRVSKVDFFENQIGEGAYLMFEIAGQGNRKYYTCTHSIGVLAVLKKPIVSEPMKNGDILACKVVSRQSTTTKGRMVYKLV